MTGRACPLDARSGRGVWVAFESQPQTASRSRFSSSGSTSPWKKRRRTAARRSDHRVWAAGNIGACSALQPCSSALRSTTLLIRVSIWLDCVSYEGGVPTERFFSYIPRSAFSTESTHAMGRVAALRAELALAVLLLCSASHGLQASGPAAAMSEQTPDSPPEQRLSLIHI